MTISWFLSILFFLFAGANGHHSRVRTVDAAGAPFPNVLVIITSLDGKGEIGRYLTDQNGRTPEIELDAGLYRLVTTCPYGICRTALHEFLGSDAPSEIVTKVDVITTDVNGEIVGAPSIRLLLLNQRGEPAAGAHVLVRDQEAKWERWYIADEKGFATVHLLGDPSVLVIAYDRKLLSQEVGLTCRSTNAAMSPAEQCRIVTPSQVITLRVGR